MSNIDFWMREAKRLAADNGKLRQALGMFFFDKRFFVSVGGNPIAVEKMLAEALSLLEPREMRDTLNAKDPTP